MSPCVYKYFLIGLFLFCSSCASRYQQPFSYIHESQEQPFIVFLVTSRQLDYSSTIGFLKSYLVHPHRKGRGGDVGHAWVYLQGNYQGCPVKLEGGHSGERGETVPKYFDGVMNLAQFGTLYPSSEDNYEPNPIKYLWETLPDGFLQLGNGGFEPTYACKIIVTQQQFERIYEYIINDEYGYSDYSLIEHQCCTFLKQIAQLIDLQLEDRVDIPIDSKIYLFGKEILFWSDNHYDTFSLSAPDILECSLRQLVVLGKAEEYLDVYKQNVSKKSFSSRIRKALSYLIHYPLYAERMRLKRAIVSTGCQLPHP